MALGIGRLSFNDSAWCSEIALGTGRLSICEYACCSEMAIDRLCDSAWCSEIAVEVDSRSRPAQGVQKLQ